MIPKDLQKLAVQQKAATQAYGQAFDKFLRELEPLPLPRFFAIAKKYFEEILRFHFELDRKHVGVKHAAEELFRKALVKEEGHVKTEDLLRFANQWRSVSHNLHDPLFDIIKGKGDDSYGDLLDNLPLLGYEAYQTLERKDYGNMDRVKWFIGITVEKLIRGQKRIDYADVYHFVWNGENYHSMMLHEAAEAHVLHLSE